MICDMWADVYGSYKYTCFAWCLIRDGMLELDEAFKLDSISDSHDMVPVRRSSLLLGTTVAKAILFVYEIWAFPSKYGDMRWLPQMKKLRMNAWRSL